MKKISLLTVTLIAVLAMGIGTVGAQQQHSIGYQGMFGTGTNLLSGISYRGWADAIGWEGTFFYGNVDVDNQATTDIWALDGQFMYAIIQNPNSKLYVGGDIAIGGWEVDIDGGGSEDDTFWWIGPLIGAQYSFQEMPELTFNWEVAYNYADTGDMDTTLHGFNTTMGIHYAF